jgi:ribonuclease HI
MFLTTDRLCPNCNFDLRAGEIRSQDDRICIYTDGSCLNNPGPGGYCAVILATDRTYTEVAGGEANTTNNRMELQAAIAALEKYQDRAKTKFRIMSDSQYLINGMKKWLPSWEKKGWKTADGKPVKNTDLWLRLKELARPHDIQWVWVKGHDGNTYNELANGRALEEAEKMARRGSARVAGKEATP